MPFDVYVGTLSQYVSRLVNLLTGMTNSPFTLAAQWSGGTYPWYALQYNDPDGYTNNNMYIIIGQNAFRTTARTATTNSYESWNYCNNTQGGYSYGRPGNMHGMFVGVATSFDTANFAVPSTASLYATFGIRAYDIVTGVGGGTSCNDTTIPYRYVDLQSTFYTWYDQYGFTFIQIPIKSAYRDVSFTMHVYRLTPFNTNITRPWWTLFTDQTALSTITDSYSYNGVNYVKFPTYPTNLCGTLTYTTSSSGYGICMDSPTSLNIPPGIANYLTGSNTYVHTFASSLRQATRPCPNAYSDGPAGPMSYYAQIRRLLDTSSSFSTWLPYGEIVYLPTALSRVDGKVYAFQPIANVARGTHPWSLTGIFAPITTLLPLSYIDSGISPGDVLSIQGNQYVAIQYSNLIGVYSYSGSTGGYYYDPCLSGGGNSTVNSDYTFYAIRYA